MYRHCFLTLLLILFWGVTQAQVSTYQKTQYSIDEGLPSNECHDVVQDSHGYLWIATDRGLCRFDGYNFKLYGISEGLTSLSCYDLFIDQEENIWITTAGKKIFVYDHESDSIHLFQYQHKIDEFSDAIITLKEVFVDSLSTVYVISNWFNLFSINKKGETHFYSSRKEFRSRNILSIDDQLVVNYDTYDKEIKVKKGKISEFRNLATKSLPLYYEDILLDLEWNVEWDGDRGGVKVWNIENRGCLVSNYDMLHFIEDTNSITSIRRKLIQSLLIQKDGRILTGELNKRGIKLYSGIDDLINNVFQPFLEEISVSQIIQDRQGNIWATTLEEGLFYFKHTNLEQLETYMQSPVKISEIEVMSNGLAYLVENNFHLTTFDLEQRISKEVKRSDYQIYSLDIGLNENKLLVSQKYSSIFEDDKWTDLRFSTGEIGSNIVYLSRMTVLDTAEIFGHQRDLFLIFTDANINDRKLTVKAFKYPYRINAVEKLGTYIYLLGTLDGLKIYDDRQVIHLDSISQLFNSRVNDIKKWKNNYLIGTQGSGLLLWNGKEKVKQFSVENGLVSNNIERLKVDGKNRIYAITKAGLSVVDLDTNDVPNISNYTVSNGLPTNEVLDVDFYKDETYIATGKGLFKISGQYAKRDLNQPIFEYVTCNDSQLQIRDLRTAFSFNENNISFHFRTLDLSLRGKINYRYKLNEAEWIRTDEPLANFASLQPGIYTFEVQSQSADMAWGPISRVDFVIKKPWWNTILFYLLLGSIFVLLVFAFYINRILKLKQENQLQTKLVELERSALLAQMNPHFIFNCLNSIQNFIISNEKDRAMEFLAQFAKMIRQNLSASADAKINLDKEISMLENYLQLEQLRFSNKFTYRINVEDTIDLYETVIPPLLIQPIVENAVLHGVQGLEQGEIKIDFNIEAAHLVVTVVDNGGGIKEHKPRHRSFGKSITEKRLDFINGIKNKDVHLKTDSSSSGTTVELRISLSSPNSKA